MYKKVKYYVLALFGLTLAAGCTNSVDETDALSQDGMVTFLPSMGSGTTRAGDTSFDTGDAIGVFASTTPSGNLTTTGNYADNVKYVYSSSRFLNAGQGIAVPKNASQQVSYYAVYPYQETTTPRFTFTVNEDQSTYDGYTKSDLLLATTTAGPNEAVVPMTFDHMMSRVLVDASELGLLPNSYRIELLAYTSSVSVDVEQQSVTTVTTSSSMNIKMCMDGTNHFKAILPPQTMNVVNVAGRLFIGNNLAQPISMRETISLVSGSSVELKLRKRGDNYYFDYGSTGNSSIPDDKEAEPNPTISNPNTPIPNIQYTSEVVGSDVLVRIDMTGIQNPETLEWLKLFGTKDPNQNIWISVDDQPKGFTVYNNADSNDDGNTIMTDIVFTVDNSGSMSEEANAVARDILSWAQLLASSGLNVRFACVGYSVSGTINGGIDFTDANGLSTFLNRSTGTSRTIGWSGSNAAQLSSAASVYRVVDECGAMAIRFADANLSFRSGANRIYVNFTDEPNQPNGNRNYSVEFFASQTNWGTSQGTVHTVYSDNPNFVEQLYYREYPWKISEYTGGTVFMTNSSFTGVDLASLPITGALQHSYIIRFHNIAHLVDGRTHIIKITILSRDGKVRGERTFTVTFTIP